MRFGMFIHWGPVSLKGTEIGWSRGKEVPREEYDRLFEQFNPALFDADEWAQIAKDAGMRYLIITSKHHDGFCIWDSQYTDYDIMSTPFKRDVLGELSAACKKAGLAFSTYHSILDWYQPDYNTIDAQGGPGFALRAGQTPSMDRYVEYLQNQLREIVTKYGPLQSMWFDGEWEKPWTVERGWTLLNYCRELDPEMLVNNRVGKGREGMEGVTKPDFAPG
ncbi:MAG: alpha-L-fucosidase, partial [Candidatus Hydrogenedentes bacterium]|nr:alpha-L-fucosidase [Candidatus Hydrogenedentota bacterium]